MKEAEEMNKTAEEISEADEILRTMEDYIHGEESRLITIARKHLKEATKHASVQNGMKLVEVNEIDNPIENETYWAIYRGAYRYYLIFKRGAWCNDFGHPLNEEEKKDYKILSEPPAKETTVSQDEPREGVQGNPMETIVYLLSGEPSEENVSEALQVAKTALFAKDQNNQDRQEFNKPTQ